MGVVQNSIDIQKIIEAGGDPTIAAKVAELEAEIGDENSGIIKDIDDLQEANALIMTSVSAIKTTADSAKATADSLNHYLNVNLTINDQLTYESVAAHKKIVKGSTVRIIIQITGLTTDGTFQLLSNLGDHAPREELYKAIDVNRGTVGYLAIRTNGNIEININTSTTNIYIDETIII